MLRTHSSFSLWLVMVPQNDPLKKSRSKVAVSPILKDISQSEVTIRQTIENGVRKAVVNTGSFFGEIVVSVIDPRGNVRVEQKTKMKPEVYLRLPLPNDRGTYFVILSNSHAGSEVVKRIQVGHSFTNNPV